MASSAENVRAGGIANCRQDIPCIIGLFPTLLLVVDLRFAVCNCDCFAIVKLTAIPGDSPSPRKVTTTALPSRFIMMSIPFPRNVYIQHNKTYRSFHEK
jgi:hypothetical protein